MQKTCGRLPAIALVALATILHSEPLFADDQQSSEASAHILQAERALQRRDYLEAAVEYRKAAEASDSVEVARKATRLGFSYGFNEQALAAAKRWIKLDKESDEARIYLGTLYFRTNDLRNSKRQFERLIKGGEDDPGMRILSLVDALRDEDQPERADKLIRMLAKPYPDSWAAHFAVAVAALGSGDGEHCRERAQRALEIKPDNVRPHLIYARSLSLEGRSDEAIDYLAHLIGDSPQPDPDARMELALLLMFDGRDDDALSQVNQVLMDQGGRLDALRLMAIINFRLERLDAAWSDFQDLLASGQYRMDALYYLGRIADYREEYDRAVRLYKEVRYGNNAVFSQRRAAAIMAHQLEDEAGAFSHLEAFAQSAPNFAVDMVIARAQLLLSLDRFDEGLEVFDKAISFRPDDQYLLLGKAELLLRADKLDDAITEYRAIVKRWPDNALTLNALGYTLADRTEEYEEAEKLIRDALERDPTNPAIIDSMGWVLYKLGHLEEGLAELQRAYEKMNDHEVAAHIVEVLAELDRRDEALEQLEQAEKKDPDSELLQRVRDRYFPESEE